MNIEERALNLINNAMQRIQPSIKNSDALLILHQVSNEHNLLRKISNLIHLLVICNQKQLFLSNELFEIVKKKYPQAPSDPISLSKWLISFLNYQENEIQNFKNRLIQIELIIKKISIKISNNSNNSLNDQIRILKQKIIALNDEKKLIAENNNSMINDLEIQLKEYKEKFNQNQMDQTEECKEIKKKMQFQIDSLNEKCLLMRNDLNYALKQKFEFENKNLELHDELKRKNAEIVSLQAIIKDLNASNTIPSSVYKYS